MQLGKKQSIGNGQMTRSWLKRFRFCKRDLLELIEELSMDLQFVSDSNTALQPVFWNRGLSECRPTGYKVFTICVRASRPPMSPPAGTAAGCRSASGCTSWCLGRGILLVTQMLWRTVHAPMTVQTRSGCILISPWRQWNLKYRY